MRIRCTLLGTIAAAALAAMASSIAIEAADAHPGAVDAQGCHRDRKAGTRHCHKAGELRTMRSGRQYVPCRRCGSRVKKRTAGNGVERGAPVAAREGVTVRGGRGPGISGGAPAFRGGGVDGGGRSGGFDVGNGLR